jgi:hypothetical protein
MNKTRQKIIDHFIYIYNNDISKIKYSSYGVLTLEYYPCLTKRDINEAQKMQDDGLVVIIPSLFNSICIVPTPKLRKEHYSK